MATSTLRSGHAAGQGAGVTLADAKFRGADEGHYPGHSRPAFPGVSACPPGGVALRMFCGLLNNVGI